jgi:hypothetical protein
MSELVSADRAAKRLSLSPHTLVRLARQGRVRSHRLRLPSDVHPLSRLRGGWLPGHYFKLSELLDDLCDPIAAGCQS